MGDIDKNNWTKDLQTQLCLYWFTCKTCSWDREMKLKQILWLAFSGLWPASCCCPLNLPQSYLSITLLWVTPTFDTFSFSISADFCFGFLVGLSDSSKLSTNWCLLMEEIDLKELIVLDRGILFHTRCLDCFLCLMRWFSVCVKSLYESLSWI